MRPNCPACNSIQTKLASQNSTFLPFSNYKCKNCGHAFILKHQKKKGGCLWLIIKFTISALFLGFILLWLFRDDLSQHSNKENKKISEFEKTSVLENTNKEDNINYQNNVIQKDQSIHETKQSIQDSLDPSETLIIKTEIKNAEWIYNWNRVDDKPIKQKVIFNKTRHSK